MKQDKTLIKQYGSLVLKASLTLILLSFSLVLSLAIQEETPQEDRAAEVLQQKIMVYDPEGRRDPFRDLLGGRTLSEEPAEGVTQITINDIVLVGILEIAGELTGIVKGPQGFPYYIKKGDKFLDGDVLEMDSYQITFRQTSDRGIPLLNPRIIVKELFEEER